MSLALTKWAREQRTGSPARKAALLGLADAYHESTGECHPNLRRIAAETEYGYSTIRQAAKELVDMGLVARTRRRRANGSSGGYDWTFPHLCGDRQERAVGTARSGRSRAPGAGAQEREVDLTGRVNGKDTGDGSPLRVVPSRTRSTPEPVLSQEQRDAIDDAIDLIDGLAGLDDRTAVTLTRMVLRHELTAEEIRHAIRATEKREDEIESAGAYLVGTLNSIAAGYSGPRPANVTAETFA